MKFIYLRSCRPQISEYHYTIIEFLYKLFLIVTPSFITGVSVDEQKPVLVSAHPSSKIHQNLNGTWVCLESEVEKI